MSSTVSEGDLKTSEGQNAGDIGLPRLYPAAIRIAAVLSRALFTMLGGWRVEGREHVPASGGLLVASSHVSYSDPIVIGLAMPRRCWFMAKEPIFRVPVIGPVSRLFLAYPVKVGGAMDRAALRRTEHLLESGEAVCIYPEGHVTRDGALQPFQSGLALLALRTGVPVVPAVILGAGRVIPLPYCIPRYVRGGIRVLFGPAIQPSEAPAGLSRREQADWLTERIREAVVGLLPRE